MQKYQFYLVWQIKLTKEELLFGMINTADEKQCEKT